MPDHFTPDELARYTDDPSRVSNLFELEAHLGACASCRETVASIRAFDESLASEELWHFADELLEGGLQQPLSELAERIESEDTAAERLLRPHLVSPFRFLWSNIHQKKRYRTGGAVRVLARESAAVREEDPLHALNLADAAIAIAEALPDDHYPARGINHLRGLAWKERANACRYLGRFDGALDALDHAERAYRRLLQHDVELAIVQYVRATVLWKRQQLNEALALARESAAAFSRFRDHMRWVHAKLLEGSILGDLQVADAARDLFLELYEDAEAIADVSIRARIVNNLANAYLNLGDTGNASKHFLIALQLYEAIGLATEVTRVHWSIGVLALVAGNFSEARRRLAIAKDECDAQSMIADAALVGLDLAEALLALGRPAEVRRVAEDVLDRAQAAGMLPAALTAAAFLRECAEAGTLTAAAVRHVRGFLHRLEAEPLLAFEPLAHD
jgi:tetratricopeptide (TPR) repeat protein